MCLFCDNYGHCITGIEKIEWMCFVLWVSSQPRRSTLCIPNPLNFLEKQEEYQDQAKLMAGASALVLVLFL